MRVEPRLVKRTAWKAILYTLIVLALIVVLLPLYWTFSTSFKPSRAILQIPPEFLPRDVIFSNYAEIFNLIPFGRFLLNSFVITGVTAVISLLLGSVAAYGLSRYKFFGSDSIFGLVVGTRMIPPISYVIPLYLLISSLGLIDNLLGVILTHLTITLPFTVWIMKGFFDELPRDFEEAAMVDGCSRLGALRVALRLALPGLFVALIFLFVESWNEFMFAVTFIQKAELKPVATSLYHFSNRWTRSWGPTNAGAVIMSVPVIIIFLLLQRRFIEGLTQGGLR